MDNPDSSLSCMGTLPSSSVTLELCTTASDDRLLFLDVEVGLVFLFYAVALLFLYYINAVNCGSLI